MRRIVALFILTALLAVSCGTDIVVQSDTGAGRESDPGGVQQPDGLNLLDAGDLDGPTLDFRLELELGQSWASTMTMAQSVSFDMPGAPPPTEIVQEIDQTVTVEEITADGNCVLVTTIDRARLANADDLDQFTVRQLEAALDEFSALITSIEITTSGETLTMEMDLRVEVDTP